MPSYDKKTEKGTNSQNRCGKKGNGRPCEQKYVTGRVRVGTVVRKVSIRVTVVRTIKKSLSPSYRQQDAVDNNGINSSSSLETDSERGRSAKVYHSKHILKLAKFDRVRSFESFRTQLCNCVEHNKMNRQQQLAYLRSAMKVEAASVLWDYGDEVTGSLT